MGVLSAYIRRMKTNAGCYIEVPMFQSLLSVSNVGMSGALSLEVEDDGVYVCVVNPGSFDTAFFKEEDRARMPPVAKSQMGDPNKLVDHIFKALKKGLHDTTYPFLPSTGYPVNAIAPEFMRKQVKKVTLDQMKHLKK